MTLKYYNSRTGRKDRRLPRPLPMRDGTLNTTPTQEDYDAESWHPFVPATIPEGKQVASSQVGIDEDGVAHEVVELEPIPPRVPPEELVTEAQVLRQLLRIYFGDGAETNRGVTARAVADYFLGQPEDAVTAGNLRDALLMERVFNQIISWTGTGESWGFFEEHMAGE
jgi:hypothetical protein